MGAGAALTLLRYRTFDRFMPELLRDRLVGLRTQLAQISVGRVARATLWTLPSWILEAGVLLVSAQALGAEITVPVAIAVTAFTILFQVFHVTPGGIGVYEASMTGALYAMGVPVAGGVGVGRPYPRPQVRVTRTPWRRRSRYSRSGMQFPSRAWARCGVPRRGDKHASRFEIFAARTWNVLNEGKPFTPVFTLGILALLSIPHLADGSYWLRAGLALLALAPMFVVFYRLRFPPEAADRPVGLPGPVHSRVPVL